MYACMNVCVFLRINVVRQPTPPTLTISLADSIPYMYACLHVCLFVGMYVCMFMFVCTSACMYVNSYT